MNFNEFEEFEEFADQFSKEFNEAKYAALEDMDICPEELQSQIDYMSMCVLEGEITAMKAKKFILGKYQHMMVSS